MSFFDQKQEVLNVTMTTYGRYLYSLGKFMPEYYAFFDDDIIYDSSYCRPQDTYIENQNEIEDRILRNTPRLKPNTNFSGVETNIKKQIKIQKSNYASQRPGHELIVGSEKSKVSMNFQHELERDYALGMPLGRTSYLNDNPPAFRVMVLAGSIDNASAVYVDPNIGGAQRIPQIDMEIKYEITAHNNSIEPSDRLIEEAKQRNHDVSFSPNFGDGTYLKIEGSHVLLMIEEDNVEVGLDQFDVEVLEEVTEVKRVIKKDDNGAPFIEKQTMTSYLPLFFDTFKDGPSPEAEENEYISEGLGASKTIGSVESYFNLNLDGEVSVRTSVLESSVADRVTMSDALQKNGSMFLSKPLLSSSISDLRRYGPDRGMLSDYEMDVYYTGITSGNPEGCD